MYITTTDNNTGGVSEWTYQVDTSSTVANPLYNSNIGYYDGLVINYSKHDVTPNNIRDWYNDLGADNTKDVTGYMRSFYATVDPQTITTQYYDGTAWCTIN